MVLPRIGIKKEEEFQINQILKSYLKQTEANFVSLMNLDGYLIATQGNTINLNMEAITVLTVSLHATAQQIAGMIGESDFRTFIYQGKKYNLHVTALDDLAILVTVFEKTTLSIIRSFSKEASESLKKILFPLSNELKVDQTPKPWSKQ